MTTNFCFGKRLATSAQIAGIAEFVVAIRLYLPVATRAVSLSCHSAWLKPASTTSTAVSGRSAAAFLVPATSISYVGLPCTKPGTKTPMRTAPWALPAVERAHPDSDAATMRASPAASLGAMRETTACFIPHPLQTLVLRG